MWGRTANPLNPNLSPGGSSGGESCLIAAGGSLLGIGSDIGGSVRIPAHFTGVFGFKGTKDRLSPVGYTASIPNVVGGKYSGSDNFVHVAQVWLFSAVVGVPGLLARSLDTLTMAFLSRSEERL